MTFYLGGVDSRSYGNKALDNHNIAGIVYIFEQDIFPSLCVISIFRIMNPSFSCHCLNVRGLEENIQCSGTCTCICSIFQWFTLTVLITADLDDLFVQIP